MADLWRGVTPSQFLAEQQRGKEEQEDRDEDDEEDEYGSDISDLDESDDEPNQAAIVSEESGGSDEDEDDDTYLKDNSSVDDEEEDGGDDKELLEMKALVINLVNERNVLLTLMNTTPSSSSSRDIDESTAPSIDESFSFFVAPPLEVTLEALEAMPRVASEHTLARTVSEDSLARKAGEENESFFFLRGMRDTLQHEMDQCSVFDGAGGCKTLASMNVFTPVAASCRKREGGDLGQPKRPKPETVEDKGSCT